MNLDSKWRESLVDTSGIFLGLILAIVLEKGIESVFLLVFEIEIIVAVIAIGIAVLLKRFQIETFRTYRRLVLKGARWVVGVLAGLLFTTGYALIILVWWLGIPLTALYIGFIVSIFHYSKIVEGDGSKPKEQGQPEVMTSSSVSDPILPASTKPEPLTGKELRNWRVGIFFVLVAFGLYTWGVNTYIKTLSVDQVNLSSPLVVQLDSFLTGGWVIGFFHYWSEWEKALRASKRARIALRGKPKDAIQFKTPERAKFYYRMLSRELSLTPDSRLFFVLVLGVVMFILSGVAAVFAILTYTLITVQLELE